MKILDVPQSGSVAGETSSRNRFGQYRRTRATPVNPNSPAQAEVRARLSANAASWRDLTDAQRAGWASLGAQMQRADSLGQTYTLTGFQAYVSVNNNLAAADEALLTDAPALATPEALASVTVTLTNAAFAVAFTPTPLDPENRVFIFASPQRSAGRQFEGDIRLIYVGAAESASPANIFAAYQAKFGTPVTGNKIFVSVSQHVSGFLSAPVLVGQVVA